MYVVNSFAIEKHGTLIDYGNYEDLRNLTNLEPIEKSGERITVTAEEDDFYYQGNLQTKDIPWHIDITYYLDGEEISASDLAGQSGKDRKSTRLNSSHVAISYAVFCLK